MHTRTSFLAKQARPLNRGYASSSLLVPPLVTFRLDSSSAQPTRKETTVNGYRVISSDAPTSTSTVSVHVKAGSRFENPSTSGASHFLKKLAFRARSGKSGLRTVRDLEYFGVSFSSQSGRDYLSFQGKGPRFGSPALDITVESIISQLSPQLLEWELNEVRPFLKDDVDELSRFESLLDAAHFEAFKGSGLANPVYCPSWNVNRLDQRHLFHHVEKNFTPDRVTIVGTGVNHGDFARLLGSVLSTEHVTAKNPELLSQEPLRPFEVAETPQNVTWNGGSLVRIAGPGKPRVIVAFPSVAKSSDDVLKFSVLVELLNADSVVAFNNTYQDAGLLGLYSEGNEGEAGKVVETLSTHIKSLDFSSEGFESAKASLKVRLFSDLEDPLTLSRSLVSGVYHTPEELVKKIDSISTADIRLVLEKLSKSSPVTVVGGDVRGV